MSTNDEENKEEVEATSSPPMSPRRRKKKKEAESRAASPANVGDGDIEMAAVEAKERVAGAPLDAHMAAQFIRMADANRNDVTTVSECCTLINVMRASAELRSYDIPNLRVMDNLLAALKKEKPSDSDKVTAADVQRASVNVGQTESTEAINKAVKRAIQVLQSRKAFGVRFDLFLVAVLQIIIAIFVFAFWFLQQSEYREKPPTEDEFNTLLATAVETGKPVTFDGVQVNSTQDAYDLGIIGVEHRLTYQDGGDHFYPELMYVAFGIHCLIFLWTLVPYRVTDIGAKPFWRPFGFIGNCWHHVLKPKYNITWVTSSTKAAVLNALIGILYAISGWVAAVWLLLLATGVLKNPEFAVTTSTMAYLTWLVFGALGLAVACTRMRNEGAVARVRERERLKSMRLALHAEEAVQTAHDLLERVLAVHTEHMALKRARSLWRAFVCVALFILAALPIGVWMFVDRFTGGNNLLRADVVLTSDPETMWTPLWFGISVIGSMFFLFSTLWEVSMHFVALEVNMELAQSLIEPSPDVPYVDPSKAHNAQGWFAVRDYLLKWDLAENIEKTNVGVGLLLLLVLVCLAAFLFMIPRDVALAICMAYLTLLFSIFLFSILASGTLIWEDQLRQRQLLQIQEFRSFSWKKRSDDEDMYDQVSLNKLIGLLTSMDRCIRALGVVPLKRSALNGLRGSVVAILSAGISFIGLDPFKAVVEPLTDVIEIKDLY